MSNPEQHYLVLCPANPAWVPDDLASLVGSLRQCGLIGSTRQPGLFNTGPAYLEWITYLGCSPQIALGEAETATAIGLRGPFNEPVFLSSATAKPRCRSCRQTLDLTMTPLKADETVICPRCETTAYAAKLDWRRKAGWGRFFIKISNVFESEAVPGEALFEQLSLDTGQAWDYFYWRKNA
ncbi:MAG: hypothetical protein HXY27_00225 [Hydrogenophilaceae bacterium]|nr:hypothetical protein [Hydrogenophilaceae bacterium]